MIWFFNALCKFKYPEMMSELNYILNVEDTLKFLFNTSFCIYLGTWLYIQYHFRLFKNLIPKNELIKVIIPKTENKTRFDSSPFDFMTSTIEAIAMDINMQKIIIVGAMRNPMVLFFNNATPVMRSVGKQIAKSNTWTGLINNPLSRILFGIILDIIAGIISESQMK